MNPNNTPMPGDLPGVDDYQITVPVYRADDVHSELRFRIPATAGPAAVALGETIAEHLAGTLPNIDGQAPWRISVADVTAERVDTRTVDEALAEMEHWKRIVTALARKMPGMMQVTSDEYEAADITDLTVMPVGPETMMFMTPVFYADMAAGLAEQQQDPVVVKVGIPERAEPLLLPAGDVGLPDSPGGTDPDVRRARVGRLGEFFGDTVEILTDGWWLPIENVSNDGAQIVLTVSLRNTGIRKTLVDPDAGELTYFDPQELVTVRPATTSGIGHQLAGHAKPWIVGHQLLHDGAWWTIVRTDWKHVPRFYTADLVNADRGELTVNVPEDDRILLRRRRPGAWS